MKSKIIGVLYPGNPSHMQGHTQAQNKGMEEDLSSKWRAKNKAGITILVSDKIDFKTTKIKRDKGYYIMVKGTMQQKELTILNIYAHNT